MSHPYADQPPKAFWRRSIAERHPLDVAAWYDPKFPLGEARIMTAGSCFAQHIGRSLKAAGFAWLDREPAPDGLPAARHQEYGYSLYSARYGNIYTARQLLQLAQRALGRFTPQEQAWERDGGLVDSFRPTLEPEPFGTQAELDALRQGHLEAVAALLHEADVLVFTLGLTEAWLSVADGAVFPLCPGTAGGTFDPARHRFHNFTTAEVRADLEAFLALARAVNPGLRLLLTVSPVPLAATATADQVAVASSFSKAVLRAVAGEICAADPRVDYFPSYEIVTAPFMRGVFYEPDARAVSPHGVAHVMKTFFAAHPPPTPVDGTPAPAPDALSEAERIKCDEELLATFGPEPS
ncbi:GSCFA domain-containing protein [Tropicibacter sp. S64]|uniref:GSCFA domain-containing protein n=1 Tax=Tropicibacter sp. S64 TaxID=3415122 RepID=UPI003C7ED2C2